MMTLSTLMAEYSTREIVLYVKVMSSSNEYDLPHLKSVSTSVEHQSSLVVQLPDRKPGRLRLAANALSLIRAANGIAMGYQIGSGDLSTDFWNWSLRSHH